MEKAGTANVKLPEPKHSRLKTKSNEYLLLSQRFKSIECDVFGVMEATSFDQVKENYSKSRPDISPKSHDS